ncbi:arginyl-tRNA--protein transferase 1 isoform X3 [Monomorium pharaonis]|uniref:arginyl-tRNA--protein transferase 1 isoform X3 n=1 Tax=Monomorium pharaonis TaxID=307658 RepID=UPI0017469F53|nr:arginyl-tRNA--protein transferase 1 isoform X3 [Monomorium pharaonis]
MRVIGVATASSTMNFSHGMWAHTLTMQNYQSLIDRDWRQSAAIVIRPAVLSIPLDAKF